MCSGFAASSASGTWCARNVPSIWIPSTTFGPVQPFGVRSTIIGHRAPLVKAMLASVALDRADLARPRGPASPP